MCPYSFLPHIKCYKDTIKFATRKLVDPPNISVTLDLRKKVLMTIIVQNLIGSKFIKSIICARDHGFRVFME